MTGKKENGGHAFPSNFVLHYQYREVDGLGYADPVHQTTPGMTQLDYFAGQALTGLLARVPMDAHQSDKSIATAAYAIASAMLEERQQWL